ncbi:ATP-binding protein [Actibacterium lipolyticum]|uniref:Serine-protein kinase RsbW n=1 Tax=Actibacterium lipolyticum TaxID=1524263 RepID=A0A238KTX1_9RHOB|nr:ATP-binding protein [Actibacterium lipolyticum]SMX46304.1 serine-protein kinase RsbW [Actibacterium lipolyticum]
MTTANGGCGFKLCFAGEPFSVRDALGQVTNWLKDRDVCEETRGSVELVLAEVLNNISEHAYRGDQPGPVELSLTCCPSAVCLCLRDQGHEMPEGSLPSGAAPDVNKQTQDLPEGGFGWFLINTLTHDLRYCREAGRNCLSFKMALDMPADTVRGAANPPQ